MNGKPAFWGLGTEGAEILGKIRKEVGIETVTEVQSAEQLDDVLHYGIDYIQIGARHMQNFPLIRWLPKRWQGKVILKRGLGNTIDEWLGVAEHLEYGGIPRENIILCERGTAHFDRTKTTRWRLDYVGVAYIKQYTDYRVIIDPSHGSGDRNLVYALSKAALAISDGLMVEVHTDPDSSPTDAVQTIDIDTFRKIGKYYEKFKPKI